MLRAMHWVLTATAVVAAGCAPATLPIRLHYDPSVNFALYRTYDWTAASGPATEQARLFDRHIRAAIENHLAAKGFLRRLSGPPDLLVSYHLSIKDTEVNSFEEFYSYRQSGGSANLIDAFGEGYEQGTLALEIVDAKTDQTVWRASAKAAIDPSEPEEHISAIVTQMLTQFPPPRQ